MKSLLTIRGNLLVINLAVIGLILWLAVSFLFIAIAQRQEALLLQDSIASEKLMSQASTALATERQLLLRHFTAENAVTSPQMAELNAAALDSEVHLAKMYQTIAPLIENLGFIQRTPTSQDNLRKQLTTLNSHMQQLVVQQDTVLVNTLQPTITRGADVINQLMDTQLAIQVDIANLSKSMKYLPEHDSASIEVYHTLLHEILATNIDLARKNIALGNVGGNTLPADSLIAFKVAMSAENIEQRLADIVRLAETNDQAEYLHAVAAQIQTFYVQEYLQKELNLDLLIAPIDPVLLADVRTQWLVIASELSRLLGELQRSAQKAIEQLAIDSASRAGRNLLIDVFLVLLCFIISLVSTLINRRVKRYAYHDSLTGLSNRLSFETSLTSTAASSSNRCAVIFLDLDRFKSINDTYGHSVGDQLLIEIAARLKELCNSTDVLARLGGDEFAVLLNNFESSDSVTALATRMVKAIEKIVLIQELNLKVGASAGISIAPHDCAAGVQLLRNADVAMYHTKTNNLSKVFRFNPDIAINYQQRLTLEQDLRKGLENQEFNLMYQPKVCTQTGKVKSVEALVRWNHPERGIVSPAEFIPIAEDTGLMGAIGFWVLDEACRELSLLQKTALPKLQVAVNISAQQFNDENFLMRVCGSLEAHQLDYSSLSLEVTESIVMTDIERVINLLKSLQNKGIDIAIDDFGTGYSSLQYLQELPLNTLKIDRAFIIALDNSDPTCSVANSIVQMASLFNLETVAEGVETLEQESKVRALGVNHIQGYRYSKPVLSSELLSTILAIEAQHQTIDWSSYNRAA